MKRIVVNGTFDILHVGHIKMLNLARSMGDYLLVCIDSDRRVTELKGANRPINSVYERSMLLSNLKAVDEVKTFDSHEELVDILLHYKADIMVKGSDHNNGACTGKLYCKEVIYFDRITEYSSTQKIQDIIVGGHMSG